MPQPSLLGRIERVHGIVDGDPVPVSNGCDARWAIDRTGRQWVRKVLIGANDLLAESVGFLLGQELGVQQPECGIHDDGTGWSWLSRRIDALEHWSPDQRDLIANLPEVGRMLALDAIIVNEDRHPRNILVESLTETRLRLWAIDHGNALVGTPSDFSSRGIHPPRPHPDTCGLPVDALKSHALAAAEVARHLPREVIERLVREGCEIAEEPGVTQVVDAMLARCHAAPSLVSGYLDALGALS